MEAGVEAGAEADAPTLTGLPASGTSVVLKDEAAPGSEVAGAVSAAAEAEVVVPPAETSCAWLESAWLESAWLESP